MRTIQKNKISILIVGLLCVISLLSSANYTRAMGYDIKAEDQLHYECKFSKYAAANPINQLESNPMNTTAIKIDVIKTDLQASTDKNVSWGTVDVKIWFLVVGNNWEVANNLQTYTINSSNIETVGNVGFEDANVTKAQIISFFTSNPYFIPIPSGLQETNWNAIKTRLDGNLLAAYSYASTSYISTRSGYTLTTTGLGINKDLTLTVTYNADGVLDLYRLFNKYLNSESVQADHVVFSAERLSQTIPDDTGVVGTEWGPIITYGTIIGAVVIGIIVIVVIYKKKH
jgi:hypothetical protein